MAATLVGPGPYIYVCTRLRVRRAKLLPREEYMRMLNMSLSEITRSIEETEYKREIDELGTAFSGIDLIEIALSWNLAKEYQKILEITPGVLKEFTRAYLRRWDIQNVLTILRGKMQGSKPGKIKEILIPAGELDKTILDRLIAEESPEQVVEALKGQKLYPVLAREVPPALSSGSLSKLENELVKQFYAELILDVESGLKGGKAFMQYIKLDIDITNVKNIFRLRADRMSEDARELVIPGSTLGVEEFQRLISMEGKDEFIDSLKARFGASDLKELIETLRTKESIREIEIDLIRLQLQQMIKMAKLSPFSIHPILAYLESKKYEIFNLRALARGKQVNLPAERIKEYLVI
jgi:V/A-type H+-transporting ATPase subunit C